ncbi:Aste57867_8931 [Aphanomyces stellatus]|uniref:Aste57867_8931 protein n=1 Tax=Aphanomyces stellatus TaxID=120398 RepID=A0A485KLH3_9STRA|nr:hypothetical protein As57867_008896 [Aphanomyces stellatus]VFT85815.1 Aste57867_8931 [Aphanomyces stellatus]
MNGRKFPLQRYPDERPAVAECLSHHIQQVWSRGDCATNAVDATSDGLVIWNSAFEAQYFPVHVKATHAYVVTLDVSIGGKSVGVVEVAVLARMEQHHAREFVAAVQKGVPRHPPPWTHRRVWCSKQHGSWHVVRHDMGSLADGPTLHTHFYMLADGLPGRRHARDHAWRVVWSRNVLRRGDSQRYLDDEFAWTSDLTIDPAHGNCPGVPPTRAYSLEFRHAVPAQRVTCNDQVLAFLPLDHKEAQGWRYELTLHVVLHPGVNTSASTTVTVDFVSTPASLQQTDGRFDASVFDGLVGGMARVQDAKLLLDLQSVHAEDIPQLRQAQCTSRRILCDPSTFFDEVTQRPKMLSWKCSA